MDDKLELTKSNKILIIITIIMAIIFVLSLIGLIFSLKDKKEEVPNLYVEKGKTSTLVATTTKKETTTTSSTTTTRKMVSPYYDINVDKIMSDEIYTKKDLTREEATNILKEFYNLTNSIYNVEDYSFIDSKTTVLNAKANEIDALEIDGNKYAIIYNASKLFKKIFSNAILSDLKTTMYDGKNLFIVKNKEYYRLYGLNLNKEIVFVSLSLDKNSGGRIYGTVKYYDANYKEEGFTAPQYETSTIALKYEEGRWILSEYKYPFYK